MKIDQSCRASAAEVTRRAEEFLDSASRVARVWPAGSRARTRAGSDGANSGRSDDGGGLHRVISVTRASETQRIDAATQSRQGNDSTQRCWPHA